MYSLTYLCSNLSTSLDFLVQFKKGSTRGTIKVKYYSNLYCPEMEVTVIILAKVTRLFQKKMLSHRHGFLFRLYTVQTPDLILLYTRCIPQMHFSIASKTFPQLIPCLEGNFTKQSDLTPNLK
jgi:hypothetical protein